MTTEQGGGAGMLARVVIGLDATEPSLKATREIAPLVKAVGGHVIAVFVHHLGAIAEPSAGEAVAIVEETLSELSVQAREDAEQLLGELGVSYEFVLRDGDPGQELLDAAHELEATMVAVGATIHGAIASVLSSSVAGFLVHHCDLPLLIVRPDPPA